MAIIAAVLGLVLLAWLLGLVTLGADMRAWSAWGGSALCWVAALVCLVAERRASLQNKKNTGESKFNSKISRRAD